MSYCHAIRPARSSEAALLSELAVRSKAYWGYSAEFIAACQEELAVSPQDISDPYRAYVVCEIDGSVIGFFAIEPINEDEYALEALFLEPQHIGHGYGRVLINEAKKLAAELGAKSLLIQGDPHAESFYRKIGGVRIGERESDSIPGRFLPEFKILLADENTA